MTGPDPRRLDLNLLLSLDALLKERNVTRAAQALSLSQPAVSAALGKLRRHFGDELLHRVGNHFELTPLGEQLLERTDGALTGVQQVFDAAPRFDPASTTRSFSVMTSDYVAAAFGAPLAQALAERAPGAQLRFQNSNPHAVDNAMRTLRGIDCMVLPYGFLSDLPSTTLFEDTWVCVVCRGNTEIGERATVDELRRLPWVVTTDRAAAFTPAARQLRLIGVEPRVQLVVESFLTVPFMVSGTNRVALLQKRAALMMAGSAGLRVFPCPWDTVPLVEALWWHPVNRADPAHSWLRRTMVDVASALPSCAD
ncbi:LysR family transcriptional regulator [Streptomyces shenzhenensis]|uniref:LysR family transcriptional regulator n=1 Tax=Streptomyces shenzhenensis TaxID=943815 RepID=UPI0015F0E4FF|nr:LysR family transcriptional regulator [Streptomyces shenzhenensis]